MKSSWLLSSASIHPSMCTCAGVEFIVQDLDRHGYVCGGFLLTHAHVNLGLTCAHIKYLPLRIMFMCVTISTLVSVYLLGILLLHSN